MTLYVHASLRNKTVIPSVGVSAVLNFVGRMKSLPLFVDSVALA